MKNTVALTWLAIICFHGAQAQTDSLVDVFPLAVGNKWSYRYLTVFEQNASPGTLTITDSGSAVYSVVGKVQTIDSTRWMFSVHRDLVHHRSVPDSTYLVRDSSSFELIERHEGQHHLYRNQSPGSIALDVFPFTKSHTDTTRVYRYRNVGSGDTIAFRSAIPLGFPNPFFRSIFTFKRAVGQTRFLYNDGRVDASYSAEHVLVSSEITSVDKSERLTHPPGFALYQNYPNPFNPSTEIRYQIPSAGHVSLKVFDLLGREMATLVNEVKQSGTHTVTWDASGFSSSVYFYRLIVGDFVETKRLVVVR